MTQRTSRLATSSMILCLLAMTAGSAAAARDEYGRVHRLHTIDQRLAETLVWELCDKKRQQEECKVQAVSPGGITVFGSDELHAAVNRVLLERDRREPETLRYHLTLVRAKARNGGKAAALPASLRKALDAVSELLPFKAFEILDSGLVTTKEWGETVFRDETGQSYSAGVRVQSVGVDDRGFRASVAVEVRQGQDNFVILGSVFNVYEGETVVAGSSRTSADAALMLVVTALALDGR